VLLANAADNNTAIGAGALLSNTNGIFSTANGAFALFSNTGGAGNTAIGTSALFSNTTGNDNTAIGRDALGNNSVGNNNTALGSGAGGGITTGSNIISIGFGVSGISTGAGQVDDSCYIGNIHGAGVEPMISSVVFVDADGKLGTDSFANGQGGNVSLPELLKDHRKVEEQAASIAALKSTVGVLTAQLKEQAAQIQNVSARLEAKNPAPQMGSLSAVARALPDEGGNNQQVIAVSPAKVVFSNPYSIPPACGWGSPTPAAADPSLSFGIRSCIQNLVQAERSHATPKTRSHFLPVAKTGDAGATRETCVCRCAQSARQQA